MSKFEIILIKANEFDIKNLINQDTPNFEKSETDLLKLKTNYIDFEKSINLLKEVCESKEVDKESFMKTIVEFTEIDENHFGDVKDCYECKDYTYQIMYRMPSQADNINKLPYNLLASYLTFDKELIYGNAVLFKTYISIDNKDEDKVESTNFENVLELMMNNLYHTGVYIDSSNNFKQIYFDNEYNIIDPFNKWRKNYNIPNIITDKQYGFKDHEYLKFNLKFVFNSSSDDSVNEPLSRLLHGIIKGDGVIYSPYSENSFYEITQEDIYDLLKVWNHLNVQMRDYKKINNNEKTKYQILNDRIKNI